MNPKDTKQNREHPSSSTPQREHKSGRDATKGVTTNPHDVGAGGGSTPLGEHGQDSRTWAQSSDNGHGDRDSRRSADRVQPEVPAKNFPHGESKEERSKAADVGTADEEADDERATLPAGKPHDKRNTM